MKITKDYLKKLIKEEIDRVNEDRYADDDVESSQDNDAKEYDMGDDKVKVGDFLQVEISDDGYDRSIEKVEEGDYKNNRSYHASFKALVKIVEIAELAED